MAVTVPSCLFSGIFFHALCSIYETSAKRRSIPFSARQASRDASGSVFIRQVLDQQPDGGGQIFGVADAQHRGSQRPLLLERAHGAMRMLSVKGSTAMAGRIAMPKPTSTMRRTLSKLDA